MIEFLLFHLLVTAQPPIEPASTLQGVEARLLDEIADAEECPAPQCGPLGDVQDMHAIQASACRIPGEDYWRYLTPSEGGVTDSEALFATYRRAVGAVIEELEQQTSAAQSLAFTADDAELASVPNEALARDILRRANLDQAAAGLFHAEAARGETPDLMARARVYCAIFDQNGDFLQRTITSSGFPELSQIGPAAQRAFMLLAIHNPDRELAADVQRAADDAFSRGEVSPRVYGRVRDFTAMILYGEQLIGHYHACENGRAVFSPPLRDRDTADRLRQMLGFARSVAEREAYMQTRMNCAG